MVKPSGRTRGTAQHAAAGGRWLVDVRSRRSLVFAAALALVAAMLSYPLISGSPASAAGGSLPAGTAISVSVDSPAEGAVLAPGPVTISGTASVDRGAGVPNTALVYAMDVSVGTSGDAGTFDEECSGSNTILDCEKRYTDEIRQAAVNGGGVTKVGMVGFGASAFSADLSEDEGTQTVIGLTDDEDAEGHPDIDQVADSAFSADLVVTDECRLAGTCQFFGGMHVYSDFTVNGANGNKPPLDGAAAIRQAVQVAGESGQPNTIVALMSDGFIGDPNQVAAALDTVPPNVHFYTISIGKNAKCAPTLKVIAERTGGVCMTPKNRFGDDGNLSHLSGLTDALENLLASRMTGFTLSVDGGPASTITDITPQTIQNGPTSITYRASANLGPGRHSLCVTAAGKDSGGPGSVTECRNVVVDLPPTVDAGGPYSGLQGSQIPINGVVSDPDSESVSTQWAIRAGQGVDSEASCTIGDAAASATSVSCDAPGTYTLTLTADDGAAQPVTAGTTVTVTNVAPEVSAGGPYTGTAETPVALTGTVTDPDSPELVTTWSVTPPPGSDPGGSTTDGTAMGGTTTEGSTTEGSTTEGTTTEGTTTESSTTDGGTTDGSATDGSATDGSTTDGSTTGDVGPPPCVFTDPTALVTEIDCPTPGSYTLTLTVNDGDNPPVSATTTLTVVPKTVPVGSLSLSATVGPAVAFVGGDPVLITYTVRNNGVIPMGGITLTTVLPAGLVDAVPAPAVLGPAGGAVCRAGAACDLGTLQPGQRRTVQFALPPRAKLDARIAATLTTTGPDTTAADNKASVRVLVRQPELLVDPTTGPPGLVVHASGHDFPAGAIVKLTWSVGGTQLPGQLIVGRDGTFNAQVLVFNHDQDGPRLLVATTVRGPRFGPVEANSFLVSKRGQEPPFDNDSNR